MKHARLSIILGAILFGAGCASDSDIPAIRERLLAATPIGTDATNVLKYVVDDLRPKKGVTSYYKYVDALQVGRHAQLDVQPLNPNPLFGEPRPSDWPPQENWPPREIYVWIKSYLNGNRLFATWTFDKNDRLLKIYVGRDRTP